MGMEVESISKTTPIGTVIAETTLNSATPDTGWIDVRGKRSLRLDCVIVPDGSGTAVVATFQHKRVDSATAYKIPEIPAGGAATALSITWTFANGNAFSIPINVEDFEFVKATFTGTGATAGDTIAVVASVGI